MQRGSKRGGAREIKDLEDELTGYIRHAAERQAKSRLELIQADVSALRARLNRDNSYAALQEALGYVHESMGVDPLDGSLSNTELNDVSSHLAINLGTWTQAETAPFNWACYPPEREDQAYNPSNFRKPEAVVEAVPAEIPATVEPVVESVAAEPAVENKLAEPVVEPVAAEKPVLEEAVSEEVVAKPVEAAVEPIETRPVAKPAPERAVALPVRSLRKFETIALAAAAASISAESAAILNQAAAFLRSHPDLAVAAIGFRDK